MPPGYGVKTPGIYCNFHFCSSLLLLLRIIRHFFSLSCLISQIPRTPSLSAMSEVSHPLLAYECSGFETFCFRSASQPSSCVCAATSPAAGATGSAFDSADTRQNIVGFIGRSTRLRLSCWGYNVVIYANRLGKTQKACRRIMPACHLRKP